MSCEGGRVSCWRWLLSMRWARNFAERSGGEHGRRCLETGQVLLYPCIGFAEAEEWQRRRSSVVCVKPRPVFYDDSEDILLTRQMLSPANSHSPGHYDRRGVGRRAEARH
ncbi:hypothetical protein SNOG_08453 [Parastagonospora nodorum SN15]|uniref:Uncharacterized protein n=1 Tax=Phaeosphaeria nodorum (strain SN15 / ATCC MYA-4574 / FGSC 10173) TaxID=321614 RepID=Q0UIG1_PHANO|nr:hypothetical protein SNOG_08453 [Parastagonospora nodorum SN15]EAT84729.1 hypothetical protein SNOG_08453 [Parastagonospora nodorum SN15]